MENQQISTTAEHSKHYSEKSFWDKLSSYALKIGGVGVYYALLLYYIMEDEETPISQKAIIMAALGYLILPIDVVPDVLFGVGFTDDIAVLMTAFKVVSQTLKPIHEVKAKKKYREWFNDEPPQVAMG